MHIVRHTLKATQGRRPALLALALEPWGPPERPALVFSSALARGFDPR